MKTHTELGITADEHAALIATIEVLRSEQIIFDMSRACSVSSHNEGDDLDRRDEKRRFRAGDDTAKPRPVCKTACCIGGTMSLLMQNDMKLPERVTPEMGDKAAAYIDTHLEPGCPLERLFWSKTDSGLEPTDGIAAIQRVLEGNTGNPWLRA